MNSKRVLERDILALLSGFMFSLSNFWTGVLIGVIAHIFSGIFSVAQIILFIISSIVLILVNIFGITKMAASLRYGDASKLDPI